MRVRMIAIAQADTDAVIGVRQQLCHDGTVVHGRADRDTITPDDEIQSPQHLGVDGRIIKAAHPTMILHAACKDRRRDWKVWNFGHWRSGTGMYAKRRDLLNPTRHIGCRR